MFMRTSVLHRFNGRFLRWAINNRNRGEALGGSALFAPSLHPHRTAGTPGTAARGCTQGYTGGCTGGVYTRTPAPALPCPALPAPALPARPGQARPGQVSHVGHVGQPARSTSSVSSVMSVNQLGQPGQSVSNRMGELFIAELSPLGPCRGGPVGAL